MRTEWKCFSEGHPQLGQIIKVRAGERVTDLGEVKMLEALGDGVVSITTDRFMNVAVRPAYEWCVVTV